MVFLISWLLFLVQRLPALAADKGPAGFGAGPFRYVVTDSCRTALRAHDHHVRHGDRPFLLGDPAGDLFRRILLRVTLDHVDVLDQQAAGLRVNIEHTAGLAAIATRDHLYLIVLFEL